MVNGSIGRSRQEPLDGVQSMVKSASPQGLLPDPRVHAAWALFFSRFISAYKEQVRSVVFKSHMYFHLTSPFHNQRRWERRTSNATFARTFLRHRRRRRRLFVMGIAFLVWWQGVDMWGLTIQNESENKGPWEACVYTPSSQVRKAMNQEHVVVAYSVKLLSSESPHTR